MPKVFEWRGYTFFYYAHEGTPREPPHIHVRRGSCEAKFWLRPFVTMARNRGFTASELKQLATQVLEHREQIERHWDAFFRN